MIFKELTQEDKLLFLTDLCGRMPFGVVCTDTYLNVTGTLSAIGLNYDMGVLDKDDGEDESVYIPNCKPYLFPLDSMTDEQKNNCPINETNLNIIKSNIGYGIIEMPWRLSYLFVDWCNKNHFDYRGLIPMGLANDATGLNIY